MHIPGMNRNSQRITLWLIRPGKKEHIYPWQKKESRIEQGGECFSHVFFAMEDIMNKVVFHSLVSKISEQSSSGLTAVHALRRNHICF